MERDLVVGCRWRSFGREHPALAHALVVVERAFPTRAGPHRWVSTRSSSAALDVDDRLPPAVAQSQLSPTPEPFAGVIRG